MNAMPRTLTLMILAVATVVATTRADVVEDLEEVVLAMESPPQQWDVAGLGNTLANILADPEAITAGDFLWASELDARLKTEPSDATAAAKRQALNALRVSAIEAARKRYLAAAVTDANRRLMVYQALLVEASKLTDSVRARTLQESLAEAMTGDLPASCRADANLQTDQKETVLRMAVDAIETIPAGPVRRAAILSLQGRIVSLGGPGCVEVAVQRAEMLARIGRRQDAVKELSAALARKTGDRASTLAAYRLRVSILTDSPGAELVADLKALATIDLPTGGAVPFREATAARRAACGSLLAAGDYSFDDYRGAMEKLLTDLLAVDGADAFDKAAQGADVLTDLSREAARRGRRAEALGYARGAYGICDDSRIDAVCGLVHALLARGIDPPPAGQDPRIHLTPAGALAAADFLRRQEGARRIGAGRRVKLTVLTADSPHFPRQLSAATHPFLASTVASLKTIGAGGDDLLTRATAEALLNRYDAGLSLVAGAVAGEKPPPDLAARLMLGGRFIRAKFESVAVENAFRRHVRYDTAGPDGVVGTTDDTANPAPVLVVPRPPNTGRLSLPSVPVRGGEPLALPAGELDGRYIHALAQLARRRDYAALRRRLSAMTVDIALLNETPGRLPKPETNFGVACGGTVRPSHSRSQIGRVVRRLRFLGWSRPMLYVHELPSGWVAAMDTTLTALADRTDRPLLAIDPAEMSLDELLGVAALARRCHPRCAAVVIDASSVDRAGGDRVLLAATLARLAAPRATVYIAIEPAGGSRWLKRIATWDDKLFSGVAVTGHTAALAASSPQAARRVYLAVGRAVKGKPVGVIRLRVGALHERLGRRDDGALLEYARLGRVLTQAGFFFVHVSED